MKSLLLKGSLLKGLLLKGLLHSRSIRTWYLTMEEKFTRDNDLLTFPFKIQQAQRSEVKKCGDPAPSVKIKFLKSRDVHVSIKLLAPELR